MYLRKALLDHLPNSMMVNTGTPARHMAMAALLHAEWSPIWSAVKPRVSGPREVAARRSYFRSSGPMNREFCLWEVGMS
jgi:hypothetical protein